MREPHPLQWYWFFFIYIHLRSFILHRNSKTVSTQFECTTNAIHKFRVWFKWLLNTKTIGEVNGAVCMQMCEWMCCVCVSEFQIQFLFYFSASIRSCPDDDDDGFMIIALSMLSSSHHTHTCTQTQTHGRSHQLPSRFELHRRSVYTRRVCCLCENQSALYFVHFFVCYICTGGQREWRQKKK